ncbi:hypothetical protein VTJ83DRAFT_4598 [Remersonia thermophila]|uniref:C2H2-type domain-containing protein n=1 Tax=Remersonia thermophila TaxID=72144 RepID=A0ABR4DBW7_9PEZI
MISGACWASGTMMFYDVDVRDGDWSSGPDATSEVSGEDDPIFFGDDTSHQGLFGMMGLNHAAVAPASFTPGSPPVQMPPNLAVHDGTVNPRDLAAFGPSSAERNALGLGVSLGNPDPYGMFSAALDTPNLGDANPWNGGATVSFGEPAVDILSPTSFFPDAPINAVGEVVEDVSEGSFDVTGSAFFPPEPARGPGDHGGVGTTVPLDSGTDSTATSFLTSFVNQSPAPELVTSHNALSMSPEEHGVPDTPRSGQDSDRSTSHTGQPGGLKCNFPGCENKTFRIPSKLRKHKKYHIPSLPCPHCPEYKGATKKEVNRHLRKCHGDLPEVRNNRSVWDEEVRCPGCSERMRKDNFNSRHKWTCPKMPESHAAGGDGIPASPPGSGRRRRSRG